MPDPCRSIPAASLGPLDSYPLPPVAAEAAWHPERCCVCGVPLAGGDRVSLAARGPMHTACAPAVEPAAGSIHAEGNRTLAPGSGASGRLGLRIILGSAAIERLERLLATGLYGRDLDDVAERLVCERLVELDAGGPL